MTMPSRVPRTREPDLPPKVQAAMSFIRLVIGDMALERQSSRYGEERVPGPLENAVYDGALLVLLEFFEAPDTRAEALSEAAESRIDAK